jgi:hypothetical protein
MQYTNKVRYLDDSNYRIVYFTYNWIFDIRIYSIPPNTGLSGIRMVSFRTQFVSDFRIHSKSGPDMFLNSLDRFSIKNILFMTLFFIKRSRLATIWKLDWNVRFSNGFGGHFVSTIWNRDRIFLATLDRFIRKGHKKYFFHAKTVYASNRTFLSRFQMVRYWNDRYWHNIQSEYRQQFGIRMPTVFNIRTIVL